MSVAPAGIHPDSLFFQSVAGPLWAKIPREDVQWLLSHPQAWREIVEKFGLENDEATVLYHILLEKLILQKRLSFPYGNLSEEETLFLLHYDLNKYELEKNIRELNTIADQLDTTHKMLTKTSLVASSSGAASGVMSILGLALVPVTAGQSLMFSAAGAGLGIATAITNVLTNVLENRSNSAARDKARRLVKTRVTSEHEAFGGIRLLPEVTAAGQGVANCVSIIRRLRAHQLAKANSGFTAMVRNFVATRHIPFWNAGGVQRAFADTSLVMTRGARVLGAAGAGLSLVQDVRNLLQNWKHLGEGARADTAEELRKLATEQELALRQLNQFYFHLQQKLSQMPQPRVPSRAVVESEVGQVVSVEHWSSRGKQKSSNKKTQARRGGLRAHAYNPSALGGQGGWIA
ncbi:apolipoprotein L5 isoform X2 [Nycticebus coucang]|uniref:apolipoprotein L5 isoform X2 n=1 Tax=Nycticebus coucang TaxID=9470 RepID=UPI00234DA29F|nr:apolipoprotein L5 isoform X2 [Nycticebus coucang]